ncbi:MAG TPA: ATP-binding protein [Gemmatimonadales bacterium]|jgi:signal transduction histidine kinase|nr:ATP-binding protein [Gemmatimonadales bacterium]
MPRDPLTRLRLRLTAWYVATFSVILLLLGGGLFLVIRHRLAVQLDRSLEEATGDLEHAARIREQESGIQGGVVDAVDELHIPERTLYLLDSTGRAVKPASADPWIAAAALTAMTRGAINLNHPGHHDRTLRLHAERFMLASGAVMVAAAVADRIELEDRYAELIVAFGSAALVALVLVAGGGWLLVRQSTAPIERNIERMRRFMADAAHELRTPLTVLRSQAEVALQQERDGPGYVAALRGVEAESQRLGRIVEDLLTIARADAGERPIARQAVYLDDIAVDAASAARAMADAKGVALVVDRFEEAPITGDPELLRQLVMIVLDNAVKFTPAGGRVELGVGAADATITLVVRDTGDGITADQLPHIFERFYRGDPARTRTARDASGQSGAGLGLAIARWIASAHGAEIAVTSRVGVGTTVTVTFPRTARDTTVSSA